MKYKAGAILAFWAVLVFGIMPVAHAVNEINRLVPFQGRLHGSDGKVVSDGVYNLTFSVYQTPAGGQSAWTETHTSVSVIHGYVNILLGATNSLNTAVDFSKKQYLGISINGAAEMFPRTQLVPSFHAYTANQAANATRAANADNADKLGNVGADKFLKTADLTTAVTGVKAGDADKLDGLDSSDFLRVNAKSVDADKLDGLDSAAFLLADAKADNADKLDGIDSTGFLKINGKAVDSAKADNATKLGDKPASDYMLASHSIDLMPVGSVIIWPIESLPSNGAYLALAGQSITEAAYPKLFAVLGRRYGGNAGSGTFKLPDYRGMFLRGWNNGRTDAFKDPAASGRTARTDGNNGVGSTQEDDVKAHSHVINGHGTWSATSQPGSQGFQNNNDSTGQRISAENTGGDESRPNNIAVQFIIKAK